MPPIPILLLIDCEPDQREVPLGAAGPWAGFELFHRFIETLRPRLAAATGGAVHFNWFWRADPQVALAFGEAGWALRRYAAEIAAAAQAGDAIGLHTHAWRFDGTAQRWISDHGDAAWVEHCIRLSAEAFRAELGRAATLFRFGDGWFDGRIVPLLEELGIEIDLTLEPGLPGGHRLTQELWTGRIPDRRNAPRRPYRPDPADFRRPDATGKTRLWEIPLSTGAPVRRPKLARPLSLWRWLRSTKRLPVALSPEIAPRHFPRAFARALDRGLYRDGDLPYVAMSVRSDAGGTEARRTAMAQNFAALMEHPDVRRFRFVTAHEALGLMNAPNP